MELDKIKLDVEQFENGETKRNPHAELRRQKVENEIVEAAKKEAKKSIPSDQLGIAIFLAKCIHFIRVKPAVRTQKAPLYFYHPDKGVYLEDDELLKDLIQIIAPKTTEKQAFDVLYKLSHKSPLKELQNEFTAWETAYITQKKIKRPSLPTKLLLLGK